MIFYTVTGESNLVHFFKLRVEFPGAVQCGCDMHFDKLIFAIVTKIK